MEKCYVIYISIKYMKGVTLWMYKEIRRRHRTLFYRKN